MTVNRFLNHLRYNGKKCPQGLDKFRWSGMLRWYGKREAAQDWLVSRKGRI